MTAPPLRLMTLKTRAGSRAHFYHFFFGVLLPLARYMAGGDDDAIPLLVEECGPMDAILDELDLPGLILLGKDEHRRLQGRMPLTTAERVSLAPYDLDAVKGDYDPVAIRAGVDWLLARLGDRVEARRQALQAEWLGQPRILIVDRGPPDPFYANDPSYASEPSRRKTAGAERRRVGNHEDLVQSLSGLYPGCRGVLLEGQSLAGQIALFQVADIVVAQHGAALSNIVWMRPDASIVELEGGAPETGYFVSLADALGLSHRFFPQEGPFGPVDVDNLIEAIEAIARNARRTRASAGDAALSAGVPVSDRSGTVAQ